MKLVLMRIQSGLDSLCIGYALIVFTWHHKLADSKQISDERGCSVTPKGYTALEKSMLA